jgi:hypothetical protein
LKDASQWPIEYDPNCVRHEVVIQLPGHHENRIEQLLYLWVSCLSILEDLADKYTGYCLTFVVASGHSTMMTVLTTVSVATTYNSSTSLGFEGTSVGMALRYVTP